MNRGGHTGLLAFRGIFENTYWLTNNGICIHTFQSWSYCVCMIYIYIKHSEKKLLRQTMTVHFKIFSAFIFAICLFRKQCEVVLKAVQHRLRRTIERIISVFTLFYLVLAFFHVWRSLERAQFNVESSPLWNGSFCDKILDNAH